MSIGVVGANGEVASELCLLLRERGHEVVPIVRNPLGGAFLQHHGFECRVGDVSDPDEAADLLTDLSAVLLTPHVHSLFDEQTPASVRDIHRALIENTAQYTVPETTLVYFSSQAAFGPNHSTRKLYTKEKQDAEAMFKQMVEANRAYILRIANVIGPNQNIIHRIKRIAAEGSRMSVPVAPNAPANVVHTVTLAEAIAGAVNYRFKPGTYTVVNQPQWSWRDVFEAYVDETTLLFDPPVKSRLSRLTQRCNELFEIVLDALEKYRTDPPVAVRRLPDSLLETLVTQLRKHRLTADDMYPATVPQFDDPSLHLDPVPGPVVPGLSPAEDLRAETDVLDQFQFQL